VPGLHDYRQFLLDLQAELYRIEDLLSQSGSSGTPCRQGCSDCCLPITVLPIEAHAIVGAISRPRHHGDTTAAGLGACGFLLEDRRCEIYTSRPFLCRTRGFPILHLNGEGEWERDACARRSFPDEPPGSPGLRLETWNARLFHLNEAFCAALGISPARCHLNALSADYSGSPSRA
jgi:Fe-S-cluster containining protein